MTLLGESYTPPQRRVLGLDGRRRGKAIKSTDLARGAV